MYRLSGRDIRKAAYSHSHQVSVVTRGTNGREMTLADLPPLIDGTINFVESGIRRRCNMTFETQNPSERFLRLLDDDNASYEVSIGIDTLEPVGVYYLRDYAIDDTGESRNYRLSLQDESALLAERKTTRTYSFAGDVIDIVQSILRTTNRSLVFSGVFNMGVALPSYFLDYDKDPIATVQALLEPYGYEILMGVKGECVIRLVPDNPSNVFCKDMNTLVLHKQEVGARRSTNHITLISRNNRQQARVDVYDNDPKSPTYILSGYGDVPETFTANGLDSETQMLIAATRLANKKFGRHATHVLSMLQIPKLDLGDGFEARGYCYTCDRISYSLVADRPMYLTGRGFVLES